MLDVPPPPRTGAFGARMARYFHLAAAPTLRTTAFTRDQLAVTRLRSEQAPPGMSEAVPPEDSYLCELQLSELRHHEWWRQGRCALRRSYARDSIRIVDLREGFCAFVGSPLDALSFYLPRAVLDEFAEDAGTGRFGELACDPGLVDPVLAHLGAALMPALLRPEEASPLFIDHVALAINAHLLERYGGLRQRAAPAAGGLSAARERLAKEYLAACSQEQLSVADIAAECGLSRAYFIQAFRQTTGVTPHKWLQRHRIEKAKELLAHSATPIAGIALACGFSDQSHLTRAFSQAVGASPAAWRRQRRQ
ncbi:MAG TPA: AraC family transcriptional regulator [Ideonella sp.]|nr:AraC family transcriptional regulator [Ideonella sp.]